MGTSGKNCSAKEANVINRHVEERWLSCVNVNLNMGKMDRCSPGMASGWKVMVTPL